MNSDKSFKKQIMEDIQIYRNEFPNIRHMEKDEWAFNFWILDKFFAIDENVIESYVTDYRDDGIDCYYFNESTKDLYIIQNKYYNDSTILDHKYVVNEFLHTPINTLREGIFSRSTTLQAEFNKYKNDPEFTVHLELYISNDNVSEEIIESVKNFRNENANKRVFVEIYTLSTIKEKYYNTEDVNKTNLDFDIPTTNSGTILNVNIEKYPIDMPINAKYIFTPVEYVYNLCKESIDAKYKLFDDNIREYLGRSSKINKKIYDTLLDEKERQNFFYYNNGITIICDKISQVTRSYSDYGVTVTLKNPQVVNGCQTVSSIYEALKSVHEDEISEKFKNTFVMMKVLQIDGDDEKLSLIKDNIVKYNNSQNSIDQKTFVARNNVFQRIQQEFEKRGFLLLIKQSDSHQYSIKYPAVSKLLDKNKEILTKYGLEFKTVNDFTIKLEKFLQVILAFKEGGHAAYLKKPRLLDAESDEFKTVLEFIQSNVNTTTVLLELYLLYLASEKAKKDSKTDDRYPISYYLIDAFALIDCKERNSEHIELSLSEDVKIKRIINKYSLMTSNYAIHYMDNNKLEYNEMIKQKIDYELFRKECILAENNMKIMSL